MSAVRAVTIKKDENGFGFTITGGDPMYDGKTHSPLYICRLRKDGAAEKTKQLQIFDHLVSINGEASDGISHDSAVHILERSQAEITLEVQTLEGAQDADGAVVGNTLKGKTLLAQVDYERVEILHNFEGGREDELVLVKGDVVHVTGKGADGWCLGACELYTSFYPHALGDTGKCQSTGKIGMFPGVFATRIAHGPEVAEALYAELEQMKPELSLNPNLEVLYEELPQQRAYSGSAGGGGGAAAGEVVYATAPKRRVSSEDLYATVDTVVDTAISEPTYSTVQSTAGGSGGDGGADSVLYSTPTPMSQRPKVKFVAAVDSDPNALYSTVNKLGSTGGASGASSAVYAPISEVSASYQPTESLYDFLGDMSGKGNTAPDAVVEDLYATVATTLSRSDSNDNGGGGGGTSSLAQRLPSLGEDIYASIPGAGANSGAATDGPPAIPVRSYDRNLLPPTFHVQVDESKGAPQPRYEEVTLGGGPPGVDGDGDSRSSSRNPRRARLGSKTYDIDSGTFVGSGTGEGVVGGNDGGAGAGAGASNSGDSLGSSPSRVDVLALEGLGIGGPSTKTRNGGDVGAGSSLAAPPVPNTRRPSEFGLAIPAEGGGRDSPRGGRDSPRSSADAIANVTSPKEEKSRLKEEKKAAKKAEKEAEKERKDAEKAKAKGEKARLKEEKKLAKEESKREKKGK